MLPSALVLAALPFLERADPVLPGLFERAGVSVVQDSASLGEALA